jgi:adhesin transport system membrane fusion protein
MEFLKNQLKLIEHKKDQKNNEIDDIKSIMKHSINSKNLLKKQIDMTKPLVERGIESKNKLLSLEREMENIKGKIESSNYSIKKFKKEINELNTKVEEANMSFENRAQKELNEVLSKISQIKERKSALGDQVTRTLVKSPVKGIVKTMRISTIGGVIKPGMDLVEIVPIGDKLIAEIKIKPSDIAFLYPGQKAKIKFTAYDFSKYGAVEAKLISVSADTIVSNDRNRSSFYIVKVETDTDSLGDEKSALKIIPGMTVSADILIGKRTVFEYITEPVFKVFGTALREK